MTSTKPPPGRPIRQLAAWRAAGLNFYAHAFFLRQLCGQRVQKVSVDGGFSCPNVDGRVATGGCVFCDNRSFSPSRRLPRQDVLLQLQVGIRQLQRRYGCERFIAYFQPATNTYAPVATLRSLYESVLAHPQVVGLAIGTRPDCVPNDVLDLLSELAERTYLCVEYGLQSIHNRSLDWMNRGHHYGAFLDAMQRSRHRGFEICAHVIVGLPDESHDDIMSTADELARLQVDSVKIHNLYVVKNTPLAEQLSRGEIDLMDHPTYVRTVVDFLERLPPTVVVERISGAAPRDFLMAPDWSLDKSGTLAALQEEFERRHTFQGRRWVSVEDPPESRVS